MKSQIQSRVSAELHAGFALRQLLCVVFIWRGMMTIVLPVCGSSAWWTSLIFLLPGAAVALLLRWVMRLTKTTTITEAARACLGKYGAVGCSILLASLLLVEAVSTLTALLTVFTQGVGTRGTQFTLAVLTGAVLLCCLHREGLPRAVYMLRWVMLAAAAVIVLFLLADAQVSNLFPLLVETQGSQIMVLQAGFSLGWPLVLTLTVPSCRKRGRLSGGFCAASVAVGLMLVTVLSIPHEVLRANNTLSAWLLLPIRYQSNAVRLVGLCLLMLSFFLALGGAVQMASASLLAPCKKQSGWLPALVLSGTVLTQTVDIQRLWAILQAAEAWLLLPLAVMAVIIFPIACCRRIKT